jgi:hypothetical protein
MYMKDIGHFYHQNIVFCQMKRYFNKQIEVTPPPNITMPIDWSNKIESCIKPVWEDMFNGDFPNIEDDIDEFKIPLAHMPKAMNRPLKFYDLSYLREIKEALLLDPMHVFKNVLDSLWKHIYSTEKDTNASSRYSFMSKTKKEL